MRRIELWDVDVEEFRLPPISVESGASADASVTRSLRRPRRPGDPPARFGRLGVISYLSQRYFVSHDFTFPVTHQESEREQNARLEADRWIRWSVIAAVALGVALSNISEVAGAATVIVVIAVMIRTVNRVLRPSIVQTRLRWVRGSHHRLISITAHDAFVHAIEQ